MTNPILWEDDVDSDFLPPSKIASDVGRATPDFEDPPAFSEGNAIRLVETLFRSHKPHPVGTSQTKGGDLVTMVSGHGGRLKIIYDLPLFQKPKIWGHTEPLTDIVLKTYFDRILESPFDEIEKGQESWREKIQQFLENAKFGYYAETARQIAVRLEFLCEPDEGEEDEITPKTESIEVFLEFLLNHEEIKNPEISLTPTGHVYAQWESSEERIFCLEFYPDRTVHYILFTPSKEKLGLILRSSGLGETADHVLENLDSFGLKTWIFNG